MGGAIAIRGFELQHDFAGPGAAEPFVSEGRTRDIATQPENRARLFSFTKKILTDITKDSSEGKSKAASGKNLIEAVEKKLVNQSIADNVLRNKMDSDENKTNN